MRQSFPLGRAFASSARKSSHPKMTVTEEVFKVLRNELKPSLPNLPDFLKGKDVNLTAEYKKVIMQHEQHETFQSKSLQGKVSVDGEQVVSLDYAAFTQEFKAWMGSDSYLKLGSYGKMCGLKVCLPSPGDVGLAMSAC